MTQGVEKYFPTDPDSKKVTQDEFYAFIGSPWDIVGSIVNVNAEGRYCIMDHYINGTRTLVGMTVDDYRSTGSHFFIWPATKAKTGAKK